MRCRFIPFLIVFVAALVTRACAASSTKPNVLFLISDDLANLLAVSADPRAKAPNLDKLAARGVRFDRAYCTYPLCGPSRNSMLTGLYLNSSGVLGNGTMFRQTIPGHVSLPQAFRHEGCLAVRIGEAGKSGRELYDHEADSKELKNLATVAATPRPSVICRRNSAPRSRRRSLRPARFPRPGMAIGRQ